MLSNLFEVLPSAPLLFGTGVINMLSSLSLPKSSSLILYIGQAPPLRCLGCLPTQAILHRLPLAGFGRGYRLDVCRLFSEGLGQRTIFSSVPAQTRSLLFPRSDGNFSACLTELRGMLPSTFSFHDQGLSAVREQCTRAIAAPFLAARVFEMLLPLVLSLH